MYDFDTTLTPAETHYSRRCAPISYDRPPATFRDGTRAPHARKSSRELRAARAFKLSMREA